MIQASVFAPVPFQDYALIDSGGAEKLERFGNVVLRRPDPQAFWSKRAVDAVWAKADLTFERESDRGGKWIARATPGKRVVSQDANGEHAAWTVRFREAVFTIRPTPFKHVGLFPEQAPNWDLVADVARDFAVERPRLLNLFGYTGAASVLAARAGYEVTHVDASKTSITWARENALASGLASDAMRVVVEDALVFARREARRNSRYHVVLLDPPHYGRGPKGEKWQFEDDIAPLVDAVRELLEAKALVVLSTYAIGCSPLTFVNLLGELGAGEIESGELALTEESGTRSLPCGFCARWSRGLAPR